MKCKLTTFALSALSFLLVAGCGKPTDFTGFWKPTCSDPFGVQIKKLPGNVFSVSFCGPGGCFAPGEWTPNTPIVGDPKYRVINSTTLEISLRGERWDRYTKCTTDTNPVLSFPKVPAPNNTGSGAGADANPGNASVQDEKDPHRPPCTGPTCQKIRAFVKEHYCGESPAGNGPDDSCDLRDRDKRSADVKAIADYSCKWDETKNEAECEQKGEVSPDLRSILARELRRLGVPEKAPGETYFIVLKSERADWLLAHAYYSHRMGGDIELCEVIAVVDQDSHVTVLRELPLKTTDMDVPTVTQWSPLDIADTRGNGQLDVILVGDAYENHWLEVISVANGSAKTLFSGLGYYL